MAGWRDGDHARPPVRRARAARRSSSAGTLPAVRVAYETWGRPRHATTARSSTRCWSARPDRRRARRRPGRPGPAHPGLVGRADRAGPRAGHRPLVRRSRPTSSAAAGARTGPSSPGAGRPAVGLALSRASPSATRSRSRPRWPTRSASTGSPPCSAARWAACARWNGPIGAPRPGRRRAGAGHRRRRHRRPDRHPDAQLLAITVRPGLARRRLLRPAARPGRRARAGPADRAPDLPQRARAGRPGSAAARSRARTRCATAASRCSPTSTTTPPSWSRRFDAGSYVVLTEAMNTHDVGRGRGGRRGRAGRDHACRSSSPASTATGSTRCACRPRSPTLSPTCGRPATSSHSPLRPRRFPDRGRRRSASWSPRRCGRSPGGPDDPGA